MHDWKGPTSQEHQSWPAPLHPHHRQSYHSHTPETVTSEVEDSILGRFQLGNDITSGEEYIITHTHTCTHTLAYIHNRNTSIALSPPFTFNNVFIFPQDLKYYMFSQKIVKHREPPKKSQQGVAPSPVDIVATLAFIYAFLKQ